VAKEIEEGNGKDEEMNYKGIGQCELVHESKKPRPLEAIC